MKSYFCYLLTSVCRTRTYIGATVNLNRRLRQHNGTCKGGANATKMHRPWTLIFCVSGFTTWSEALKFEWRWKHVFMSHCRRYRPSRGLREREKRLCELLTLYPHLKKSLVNE